MQIGRKDVIWNYAATFLKIGVGVILLPFILRVFPQETMAIWTIDRLVGFRFLSFVCTERVVCDERRKGFENERIPDC
jgi:O-antigen/teichoic acid export membrane protein